MPRLAVVAGESMSPTLRPRDVVIVAPAGRARARRGDVVVLRHDGALLVKRLVGAPGDVVELEAGRLRVGGVPSDGGPHPPGARTAAWRVPPGHWFVVGDNAVASDDSRVWPDPFVPAGDVHGVVVRRLLRWPGRGPARRVSRRRPGAGAPPAA